uniref:G-protein coupled receptors family 1 profile domain-containing protein n=1 Tax=Clytia hemisphaerica TaxID=252671 RepID=A0A7M6DJS1_9CNID
MDTQQLLVVILSLFSTVLHSVGFVLLWRAKKVTNQYNKSQTLYLLHLSFTETLYSISGSLRILANVINRPDAELWVFIGSSGVFIQLTMILIALTFDRYLAVRYNLRYLLIWTTKKTTIVIASIYFINILFTILSINFLHSIQQAYDVFSQFAWLPLDGVFVTVALLAYGYILHKIAQRKLSLNETESSRTSSSNHKRRRKPFLMVLALILSFTIFVVVPDIVALVFNRQNKEMSQSVELYLSFSFRAGIIVDFFIYVFGCREVRLMLKKCLRRDRNNNRDTVFVNGYTTRTTTHK